MSERQQYGLIQTAKYIARHPVDSLIRKVRPTDLQKLPKPPRRQTPEERIEAQNDLLAGREEFDESRRRFLIGGAAVVGGAAILGGGYIGHRLLEGFEGPYNNVEFNGSVVETGRYLSQWNQEIGRDKEKLERYIPAIVRATTAFYASQAGYSKEQLQKRTTIVDSDDFFHHLLETGSEASTDTLAFVDVMEDKMYVHKQFARSLSVGEGASRRLAEIAFFIVLHELHHLSPPTRSYPEGIRVFGVEDTIVHQKGLGSFAVDAKKSTPKRQTFTAYKTLLEELVVHHATGQKAKALGTISLSGTDYDNHVKLYENAILKPYYNGNHSELLFYQQQTRPDDFFGSIGAKLGVVGSRENQIAAGNDLMRQLFR